MTTKTTTQRQKSSKLMKMFKNHQTSSKLTFKNQTLSKFFAPRDNATIGDELLLGGCAPD
jgi:hypothetical protein